MKMEAEAFHKKGYKPASDYDRCLQRIENVLRYWKRRDKQHSPNKVVEYLDFAYHEFSLTRYWITGISSDNGIETAILKSQKKGNTLNQQKDMPKAWLDMLDSSNLFPRHDAHHLHRCYGLKEFIVIAIYGEKDISYEMCDILLSIFSFVAIKCKCQLPLFVEYASKYGAPTWMNPGILEYPGFSTSFKSWEGCHMKTDSEVSLKDVIDNFQYYMRHEFQGPVKVSVTLTYYIDISELSYNPSKEQPRYLSSTTDFGAGGCDRLRYDKKGCPNIEFYLDASWSDQLDSEVISCENKKGFNPLNAPKWSIRADIEDTSEVSLGDCLKRFLSLCSSTQTGSLLSNPEIFSMLKYRRIYKQTEEVMQGFKVRKITSKLNLKPEESLIPVESLDVILDFLFHDAKLQSSQHSNGSNPSTTTTVEDYVEDKFFLSYKELSKYLTRPSSLLSRLAICLCIVNKYHGGLGAVNQLWAEFVLELKYCLENNCEIKGLEPVEPELDYRELRQKLQMLNRCIKKKDGDASSPISKAITTININTLNFNEKFTDISELPLEKSIGLSEVRSRVGLSRSAPNLRIQMLFDRILAKDAFYAANPGCAIGDFVRWCSDEYWMEELVTDEGKDKITNKIHQGHLNQWIQISDNVSLVFHESKRQRRFSRDVAVAKMVLPWLALVEPSDLVLKLMPTLILSTVTILLENPVCRLAFLREHLVRFRKKLIDQFHYKAPQCTSSEMKMLEEHIHHLVIIEQKMVRAQYLLKAFRCVDSSYMVSDTELEKYVCNLVEFKEVPVKTSTGELPSNTSFGKLIYKLFHDHEEATREGKKVVKERKSETEVAKVNLKPEFKEYVTIIDCSSTTGTCIRLHGTGHKNHFQIAAAFTNKERPLY